MPQLIITRGIPKSGKTSYVKKVFPAAYYCSADDYHVTPGGKYEFKAENLGNAHAWCFGKCYRAMADGFQTIIVDNTNIHAWEIAPYIALANLFGYDHKIIWVKTPIEVCLKRDNSHGVPDWKLGMMYQSIMNEKLPPFWNQEVITN